MQERVEELGNGIRIFTSKAHSFGSDAFALSWFASPKRWENACDLCTGCGIVPLLWFTAELPPKTAWGVDIQPEAIALMKQSMEESGLVDRFRPVWGDLRKPAELAPTGSFDLMTCNPPYRIEGSGILSQTEADQIARHETMCTLDDVMHAATRLLRYKGRLCVCHLPERLSDVISAMRAHGLEPKRLRFCQARVDKAPWLVLVEGILGGKPGGLRVEPVFLLELNGSPTPEAEAMYRRYRKTAE